ncbi:hypothetical protein DSLASN_12360 [Desulfoluna limicola]|uniref:Beta-barrel porin 2 n=1 Tax=Desulfoluna limicola TaxID=2810562 RepID=A0ABM7PE92_9BACT|nr:hypothetical protein DSLASN_12360 [Desulfoluna limicola]
MVCGLLILATATSGWCSLFSRETLGIESGVVHPFIKVDGEYTDNLFATNGNEEEDYVSYVSPGFWLALPGSDTEVINLATMSSAPGGMAQTRFQAEDMGRFQTYLKYAPTFENYADFDERDFTSHQFDAYAAFNLAGGLSFELMDQYKDNRDGVEEETDSAEYTNNLVGLTTSYAITDKMKARVDVGYYDVNYDSKNPEKDREDTSVTGYLFFEVRPKTNLFGEVTHVDIDYDSVDRDSEEIKAYGGVTYNATDRIDAMLKVGMMRKDIDAIDQTDDTISMEGSLSYDLTARVNLSATANRLNKETTTGNSRYVTETGTSLTGSYLLTDRVSTSLMLSFRDEEYDGIDRDDTTVTASPQVSYTFNNNFFASLSYSYTDRDVDGNDVTDSSAYTENSVMVSVTASL